MYDEKVALLTGTLHPGLDPAQGRDALRDILCGDGAPAVRAGDLGFQIERHSPGFQGEVATSYAWIKGAAGPARNSR